MNDSVHKSRPLMPLGYVWRGYQKLSSQYRDSVMGRIDKDKKKETDGNPK